MPLGRANSRKTREAAVGYHCQGTAKVSQKPTHYLRSSILAEPYPNLAPIPRESQSRTRSPTTSKREGVRYCLWLAAPTLDCTPHKQALPLCYSLRWGCFSDNEKPWFPTPLSTRALQYLQALKREDACWYYCTPKLSLICGISYTAKPDTTNNCHNLIYTFTREKLKHPNLSISVALALVCVSVTLPCTSSL